MHGNGSDYRIAVMDMATKSVNVITDGRSDESPSFAPNSRVILYATKVNGRGALAAVSSDGKVRQRLNDSSGGDVREPAWGPLAN